MTYLTTSDNPWNPFENWDAWLAYDMSQGYHTCERIARLAPMSDALPDTINTDSLNQAMDFLIKNGAINKDGKYVDYVKITKD